MRDAQLNRMRLRRRVHVHHPGAARAARALHLVAEPVTQPGARDGARRVDGREQERAPEPRQRDAQTAFPAPRQGSRCARTPPGLRELRRSAWRAGIMGISMGKVVELETPRTDSRAARSRRGRQRRSKTALVLGGGGFTGGVYEIGALRALDLLAVNRTDQRVRRLRGNQRGRVRGQHGGERDHPRGDDAGAEPRAAVAASRHLARHPAEAQLRRLRAQVAHLPAAGGGGGEGAGQPPERAVGRRRGHRPGQRLADRHLHRARDRELRRRGALGPRSKQRLPAARLRAVPDRDRPRHDRARGARRGRLGRRPDLDRGRGLGRAADDLRAGRDQRPRVHRRRHPLDHERRCRGRARRQVHRRHQPAGALRERLQQADPDRHRHPGAPRLRHGVHGDRQPGLPAALPRAPARRGPALGAALSGRRHHPDRARARRRADVRHLHPRLQRPPRDRQARLRVGDHEARPRLRALQVDRRAPRHPDLGSPRPPRARPGRARAGAAVGLAARLGADDRGAAQAAAELRGRGAGLRGSGAD